MLVALGMPLLLLTGCATVEQQSMSLVPATEHSRSDSPVSAQTAAVTTEDLISPEVRAAAVPTNEDSNDSVLKDGEEAWDGPPLPMLWNLPQIRAYNDIQEYLERNSDDNGGVSVVESDHLVIHLLDGTTATAEFDTLVEAARAVGSTVEFDVVQRPLAELLRLQFTSIPENLSSSQLFAGTKVVKWGVQPATNSVEVTVTEVTPELGGRVFAEFGPAVTVVQGVDDHMFVALGRLPREGSAPK